MRPKRATKTRQALSSTNAAASTSDFGENRVWGGGAQVKYLGAGRRAGASLEATRDTGSCVSAPTVSFS